MERQYNYQAFTPEEVEEGLHLDLLNYLLEHNKKNETQYYDIHITSDGYCTIIEWIDVRYDKIFGEENHFEFVPYNGCVMLEYSFPDDHREFCYDEQDYKERLDEFLKENPGWIKGQFGNWVNELENNSYSEMAETDKED